MTAAVERRPEPRLLREVRVMQAWSDAERAAGRTVGFVPTMGALHEGHLDLVRRAKADCDRVVVSIFVNPTQFGPNEDFDSYPRTEAADVAALAELGVDAAFVPPASQMYPAEGRRVWVTVDELGDHWCGAARPGFFRGVATVVSKLFNAVKPHRAYFGEKDFQQLQILRRLAAELLWDIEIVGVPTVREADGLAMSSRNAYLDATARAAAPGMYRALQAASRRAAAGADADDVLAELAADLNRIPGAEVDYVGIADPETMQPITSGPAAGARALCAVFLGGARLIDNVNLGGDPEAPPAA